MRCWNHQSYLISWSCQGVYQETMNEINPIVQFVPEACGCRLQQMQPATELMIAWAMMSTITAPSPRAKAGLFGYMHSPGVVTCTSDAWKKKSTHSINIQTAACKNEAPVILSVTSHGQFLAQASDRAKKLTIFLSLQGRRGMPANERRRRRR